VVTWGAAIALYIVAWIILQRDDRPPRSAGGYQWHDWSEEFHSETHRLAEEARRKAGEVGHTWQHTRAPTESTPPTEPAAPTDPAHDDLGPRYDVEHQYDYDRDMDRHRRHGRHPRSMGIVLVGLGVLLLAANAGVFSWIEWGKLWPVIIIGLGIIML